MASKTFVDQVAPVTGRVYELVPTAEQGKYHIRDVTSYIVEGTPWAAEDANHVYEEAESALHTLQGGAVQIEDGDLDITQPLATSTSEKVQIKSAANRIDSVTVHGFTTQDGSGDQSHSNVREIRNAGICNKVITITKDSPLLLTGEASIIGGSRRAQFAVPDLSPIAESELANLICDLLPTRTAIETYYEGTPGISATNYPGYSYIQFRISGCLTIEDYKSWLTDHPLTVAYQSTENTGKHYTGIEVTQGDDYHCAIVEIHDRLHEGDTLNTNTLYAGAQKCVESHVKATVVVDGQTTLFTQGTNGYTVSLPNAQSGSVLCNVFSGLLANNQSVTIPESNFPASVTDLTSANQWAQGQNVQIEYTLTAPEIYADVPVNVENPKGTYTVSGEDGTEVQAFITAIPSLDNLGVVPNTRTVNGKSLDKDITISKEDVGLGKVVNKTLNMSLSGTTLTITYN